MRKKKLLWNTISSLVFQITTIICGFILPRIILQHFGSQVNGLVLSITQFLQVIAFLELGVGAVVQSSLYKPLADKDFERVSKIIVSANNFFKRLAEALLIYVVVLLFIYPKLVNNNFDFFFTATLILAMSISFFAQYYFGVVDRLLLTSDQRGYIQYNTQTITLILNTVACAFLIYAGGSIHIVKLTTSLIYLIRPVILRIYVNRHYKIDRKIRYNEEPIKQKWNGVAQHISSVVLDNTDTIVLTVLSTLENVSIYSVYHLVIYGVKQLFTSMTHGIQALLGELWAKQELTLLKETFAQFEWSIHTGATFIFGCTGMLIVPFVSVYTAGINDANYIVPTFAVIITIAHATHCLRLPYNIMILAGGHYKQTQSNYIIAALMNVIISVILVYKFGLVGAASGTLTAMLYQTVWMACYNSKELIKWPIRNFVKQIAVDVLTVTCAIAASIWIRLDKCTYFSWLSMAVEIVCIWLIIVFTVNWIFYRKMMVSVLRALTSKFLRK